MNIVKTTVDRTGRNSRISVDSLTEIGRRTTLDFMKKPQSTRIHRRQFIQRAGLGVALFNILPSRFVNGAETPAPSGKVNVVGIGIGSRGGADVKEVAALGHNIVALCDVDENYAAKEFAKY